MKTTLIILVNILIISVNSVYSQTNWYEQSINDDGIKVSFPEKPKTIYEPVSNSDMYLFDNTNSNFIVMRSPTLNISSTNNLHSNKIVSDIENTLTEFNKEQIISTTKSFYKNRKAVDIYYKKYFQNSFYLYHRARAVQVKDYYILLLYTYIDYNSFDNDKFFNSLIFE